jgi:hypothetical protein
MTPQQLIRTILDAVAEDDLRKAEDAIRDNAMDFLKWVWFDTKLELASFYDFKGWYHVGKEDVILTDKDVYELFTQQNKP